MSDFIVKALDESTWPDFARLVEKHNGVWGGCWCMGFHEEGVGRTHAIHRAEKEARVREGRAHAALVYDGETAVGAGRGIGGNRPTWPLDYCKFLLA